MHQRVFLVVDSGVVKGAVRKFRSSSIAFIISCDATRRGGASPSTFILKSFGSPLGATPVTPLPDERACRSGMPIVLDVSRLCLDRFLFQNMRGKRC